MPRIFRRSKDAPTEDANMLPVMNIMFLLIPALLLSMEVASLAAISVSPPAFSINPTRSDAEPSNKPTTLRVRIYEDGFGIELRGGTDRPDAAAATSGPSIPLARASAAIDDPTRWDYAALAARIDELRPSLDEGANLEISAERSVTMQTLVSTIDAAQDREHPLPLIIAES
ncbi:ExbD/TolR family protein [Nannocystaceae bacterium ST9]